MKDLFELGGKVAIVTGGRRGIGKAIALAFAEVGADVAICDKVIEDGKLEAVAKEMRNGFGIRVLVAQVDVQQEQEVNTMVAEALDMFGRIDILVNNAGVNIRKMPQDYLIAEWDEVLNTNLRSAFLCSKAVYLAMKKTGGGKIINIGSMTSIFGSAKMAPYGASKGGILQLTRSLAVAWAPDNIQVNAVLPGFINTDLTAQSRKEIPGYSERAVARTPVGRWGNPDDLIGSAIFLASHASDFITGIALPVDGGYSIMI